MFTLRFKASAIRPIDRSRESRGSFSRSDRMALAKSKRRNASWLGAALRFRDADDYISVSCALPRTVMDNVIHRSKSAVGRELLHPRLKSSFRFSPLPCPPE